MNEICATVNIHNVTSSDIKVHKIDDIQWINVGSTLDVFAKSLEDIRNIGHELIRQTNKLEERGRSERVMMLPKRIFVISE